MDATCTCASSKAGATARSWRASLALALALLAAGPAGATEEPLAAVWKARDITFDYGSESAIFTCEALAGRVATLLRAVGARDDAEVTVNNCSRYVTAPESGMSTVSSRTAPALPTDRNLDRRTAQWVQVRARVMMPVEVTPEVYAELKKDKTRRELVSRVTGDPLPQFNDPVLFSAQWQPVTLSRQTVGLAPQECELLDQMSATAFRMLGLRVLHGSLHCSPRSKISPQLVVQALVATPYRPEDPAPAAGEEGAGVPSDGEAAPVERGPATQ